jgi:hypothetical protein
MLNILIQRKEVIMEKDVRVKEYITPEARRKQRKIRKGKAYRGLWYKLIVFSFFVMIFGLLALRLILPVPTTSLSENRELKKMPSTDISNIFFGKFTTDFEDYFADTFPLRDPLIEAGDYVSYLFKIPVSGVDSIVVLDENMMQEEGTGEEDSSEQEGDPADGQDPAEEVPSSTPSEDVANPDTGETPPQPAEDMQEKGIYLLTDKAIYMEVKLDPKRYTAFAEGINKFAGTLPGRRIIVMSPANSFAFYADPKYRNPENDQKAGIEDMYSLMDPGIYKVDTYSYLENHTGEYIYFRTDHHWTALGAYYGYTAFCGAVGLEPVSLDTMPKNLFHDNFLGALYKQTKNYAKAKLVKNNPDYVEYYEPAAKCELTTYKKTPLTGGKKIPLFDKDLPSGTNNYYRIFLGGDYPIIKITTDTQNGKSIAILKDSYANAFVPYLTAHYQTIYVIDFRDFNKGSNPKFHLAQFVEDNDIDDVLLQMNFRYTGIPGDVEWYLKACS